jgi:hypothetical protein
MRVVRKSSVVGHSQSNQRTRDPSARRAVRSGAILALLPLSLTIFAQGAQAQTNLVVNGTFSQAVIGGVTTVAQSAEFGSTNNGFTPVQQLVGWSTAGYNFVFLPNTDGSTGTNGQDGNVSFWGPSGTNKGTNASVLPLSSPTGGNLIGADGAFEISAITQTISGLTVGKTYAVSFAWAGAQQFSFTGPTTDQWTVSLGTVSPTNRAQSTTVLSLPTEGASAWMNQTFDFVANSSSEVLSFLSTGTPAGQPPFTLLANVSMTQVPEPASLTIIATGLVGLAAAARRHRRSSGPAAATT